jgi:hypothetical protein
MEEKVFVKIIEKTIRHVFIYEKESPLRRGL